MKYTINVLRRRSSSDSPQWKSYFFETEKQGATVATALTALNQELDEKIMWECSCLQKKCGACAMVINGRPQLACDARLTDFKTNTISVEPLRKFPVIADLVVDRSVLYENLALIGAFLSSDVSVKEKQTDFLYEASRCLQCGCCLEICPNFYSGGAFFGMAAMVPVSRLLEELPSSEQRALRKKYQKHIYSGCGKSLACRDICPAGLDMERLLVNSNAIALWKYLLKK